MQKSRTLRLLPRFAWPMIGLLILVLSAFALKRTIETYNGAIPPGLFEARYLEHPIVSGLHMLSGILFILLAPLQFIKKFRTKNLQRHRVLGRLLLTCGLISGVYGIISIFVLPVFGGIDSQTAAWFFGPIFLFSLVRGFWCIRNKKITEHREWMIRAFAVGLAVGSQRIYLIVMMIITGQSMESVFGLALWMGFTTNLFLAEVWINLSRKTR